jgi:hypothetical protein
MAIFWRGHDWLNLVWAAATLPLFPVPFLSRGSFDVRRNFFRVIGRMY